MRQPKKPCLRARFRHSSFHNTGLLKEQTQNVTSGENMFGYELYLSDNEKTGFMEVVVGTKGYRRWAQVPWTAPAHAENLAILLTRRGWPKIVETSKAETGSVLAFLSASGGYATGGNIGDCVVPMAHVPNVKLIASGETRTGMEYLAVVKAGTVVRVEPAGMRPHYLCFHMGGGVKQVSSLEDARNLSAALSWPQFDFSDNISIGAFAAPTGIKE